MTITVCRTAPSYFVFKTFNSRGTLISSGFTSHSFEAKKFSDFRSYLVVFVEGFMKSVCIGRL